MSILYKYLGWWPRTYEEIVDKITKKGHEKLNISFNKPLYTHSSCSTKIWLGNGKREYYLGRSYSEAIVAFDKITVEEQALRIALNTAKDLQKRNFKVEINNQEVEKTQERLDQIVNWNDTCTSAVYK